MFRLTFACFFTCLPLLFFQILQPICPFLSVTFSMSSHVSLPFFFIRALHPLPPLFTLSYEHHPNITIQELPFTLLLGWHHVVCPISWHMCVFPGKYLNGFILPTNLLSSLEMLQNSGLEMIFPQDFEGNVVLSGICGGTGIQSLFMWPCFVGLLVFFFLSLEALRIFCPWCCGISWWCTIVWVFLRIYLSGCTVGLVITTPCTSGLGHFLLVFLWGFFLLIFSFYLILFHNIHS